jgi:hypothetical protein
MRIFTTVRAVIYRVGGDFSIDVRRWPWQYFDRNSISYLGRNVVMSQSGNAPYGAPEVDITALQERKLLEAELFGLDAQARHFGRIRDRLAAAGKDGVAHYRKMQARRDEISATLKRLGSVGLSPQAGGSGSPFQRPDELLLSLPIAPARFIRDLGVFGFGTSGVVQMAPASEGVNVVAHGQHPSEGEITTVPDSYPGSVTYSGILHVGPESIPPDQYDPTINYFWVHNWKYLIPFPAPTVQSRFTYRFDVYARTTIFFSPGEAQAMAFVSLGETANLTTGSNVTVNIDGGWPLMADLTQPVDFYNGHYGFIDGSVSVQRSFMVGANHVPGIAVVVGAVGALSMMTEVRLTFAEFSSISVGSQNMTGRVAYSYEPVLVAHP